MSYTTARAADLLRNIAVCLVLFSVAAITPSAGQDSRAEPPSSISILNPGSLTNAADLPSWVAEEDLGLLPEDPNDQPHFLPLSSPKRDTPVPLADTSDRGQWDQRFGMPGLSGQVYAAVVAGDEIYVGGSFRTAGGRIANNIAMWDGNSWHTLANGVNDQVYAIAISGDNVYVGGVFIEASGLPVNKIAVWNRRTKQWGTLGDGVGGHRFAYIATLAVDGDDLYVGGRFLTAGRIVAVNIAKWSNGRWSRVGGGANSYVFSLKIDGDDLYVGGRFTVADDKPIRRIARVDRSTNEWTELASGVRYKDSGYVSAIAMTGKDIYIGGKFRFAGPDDHLVNSIARYNSGTKSWSDLGLGVNMQLQLTNVYALAVRGNHLFVGGRFDSVDAIPSGYIWESLAVGWSRRAYNFARWDADTRTWNLFQREPPIARANSTGVANIGPDFDFRHGLVSNLESAFIATFDFNGKGDLVIGGSFSFAGPIVERSGNMNGIIPNNEDVYADNICLFDNDTTWSMLGSGLGGPAFALTSLGEDVIVGGTFKTAGPIAASNIVRWNRTSGAWTSLGPGLPGPVNAIAADATAIFAAGSFSTLDGTTPANVARWDLAQSRWSALPNSPFAPNIAVNALALQGNTLYAGGANGVFAWNGSNWTPLGSNVGGPVYAITVVGDDVYVGGKFSLAGGIQAASLAIWNSATQSWSSLGNGVDGQVNAIAIDDQQIYIGGSFTSAGGTSARNIAVWDRGTNEWATLGEGIDGSVNALTFLNGSLFAAGNFPRIGVSPMNSISRWDGYGWHEVDRGLFDKNGEGNVYALATVEKELYAAGSFIQAGNAVSYNFGRWTSTVSGVDAPRRFLPSSTTTLNVSPNPIGSETVIRFRLTTPTNVRLSIHDATGCELKILVDEAMEAGEHQMTWRADDLPQGTYFCELRTADVHRTETIVVSR